MRLSSLFTLALLLITPLFVLSHTAEAQQLVCPQRAIEQITNDPDGTSNEPSINADGTRVAFESSANIGGGNPDGNGEIYLFDTQSGMFTQITDTMGGQNSAPSINADGTRVAFESNANVVGPNPGGNFEIYLFDSTDGTVTQITETMGPAGSSSPSINADGMRIAFSSGANIVGPNPGNNTEIYIFNTTTGIFTQVTDEITGNSFNPSINADGTRVAFASNANVVGPNPGDNDQIYLFDTLGGIRQVTSEPSEDSDEPSINADGTRIAFDSGANINGGNPDGREEIYLFDTTTGIITQITNDPSEESDDPSINADGTRIAFESNSNINGENPDESNQIFVFDTVTGMFSQVMIGPSGSARRASINADGTSVAFESGANINGGNPEGNLQVWLARCFDPMTARNIPTMSEWGLIATAGVLGIVGLLVIRRRTATDT